jgi:hypothetical protein
MKLENFLDWKVTLLGSTMEPPFSVPQFISFSHLKFSFIDPQEAISKAIQGSVKTK